MGSWPFLIELKCGYDARLWSFIPWSCIEGFWLSDSTNTRANAHALTFMHFMPSVWSNYGWSGMFHSWRTLHIKPRGCSVRADCLSGDDPVECEGSQHVTPLLLLLSSVCSFTGVQAVMMLWGNASEWLFWLVLTRPCQWHAGFQCENPSCLDFCTSGVIKAF